jgi:hypothetical protein
MSKFSVIFFAVFFLFIGCADIPKPTNFKSSIQPQLQSATHWQQLARITSDRLTSDSALLDNVKKHYKNTESSVCILNYGTSPFDIAFYKYLTTEFVNSGYTILDNDNSPIKINWEIQLVNRNKDRGKPLLGIPEFIADGVVRLLTGISWNTSDYLTPHTEVIMTTRITIGPDIPSNIARSYSDTFYINDEDWANYVSPKQAVYARSIAGKEEMWKMKLRQKGLLSD